jgi:hypothetical protein
MSFSSSDLPPLPDHPRLDLKLAIQDGWRAFQWAPWTLIGFAWLVMVLHLLTNGLSNLLGLFLGNLKPLGPTLDDPSSVVLALVGVVVALVGAALSYAVSLWGTIGLIRGAWWAVEGTPIRFADLCRWDGQAIRRLIPPGLLLGGLSLAVGLLLLLAMQGLMRLNTALGLLPLLAGLGMAIYFMVNQRFLAPLALLQGPGAKATLQLGRERVDPIWGQVFALIAVEGGLILLGLLACLVGLFVAVPLATCIAIAAYRQLFGAVDHTGFTAYLPANLQP